jgi:hypothetical protein
MADRVDHEVSVADVVQVSRQRPDAWTIHPPRSKITI